MANARPKEKLDILTQRGLLMKMRQASAENTVRRRFCSR